MAVAIFSITTVKASEDSVKIKEYIFFGDSALAKNKYSEAVLFYDTASRMAESTQFFRLFTQSEHNKSWAYMRLGEFERSLSVSKELINYSIDTLGENNLVEAHEFVTFIELKARLSQLDSAVYYGIKALNIFEANRDLKGSERTLNSLGAVYSYKANNDSAAYYFNRALRVRIKLYGAIHKDVAGSYNNLGVLYQNLGQLGLASEYLHKALNIYDVLKTTNLYSLSNVYMNLGGIYYDQMEFEKALDNYKISIRLRRKIFGEEHHQIVEMYNNIGNTYQYMKEYDSALFYLEKAKKMSIKSFGESHIAVSRAYLNLGRLFYELGDINKSSEFYLKSLKSGLPVFGAKHVDIANIYWNLALNCYTLNKTEESLRYIEKSYSSNMFSSTFDSLGLEGLNIEDFLSHRLLIENLVVEARVYEKRFDQSVNIEHLITSHNKYNLAIKFLHELIKTYVSERDRIQSKAILNKVYSGAVRVGVKLNGLDGSIEVFEACINTLNRYKSDVLLGASSNMSSVHKHTIPDSLSNRIRYLARQINKLKTEMLDIEQKEDNNQSQIIVKKNELFDLKRTKEEVEQLIKSDFPKYYDFKYGSEPTSVIKLQNVLTDQDMLIEYFVTDSVIYTFSISPDTVQVFSQQSSLQLVELIESHNTAIFKSNKELFVNTSNILFNTLIAPLHISKEVSNLVIIPDDILWKVNFDLLLSSKENSESYRSLSYLLNQYAISYNYSSGLVSNNETTNGSMGNGELLAFSYGEKRIADSGGITGLDIFRNEKVELPGSTSEIFNISELMDGIYFYGNEANESNFKANAERYSIIHLAVHGEIDDEKSDYSNLKFYGDEDESEDGKLHVFELYDMNLKAQLAVLSACNSGSGKIIKGEGIMSLGRAFIYAGVNSILISKWDVSDYTTPKIMKAFYENLLDGDTKSESLRKAKLYYLKQADEINSAPYYWGAFYLMGNRNTLNLSSSKNIIYWFALIILIFLGMVVWKKARVNHL